MTSRKIVVVLVIFLFTKITKGQSVSTLMGARAAGISYASSVLTDEWSLLNNVGGLAGVDRASIAFAVDVRPSGIGANRLAAALTIPSAWGVMGAGLFRFGDALYNEQIASIGYANQLGIASLGLKANYIQYHAEGFGTKSAVTINFGGIAQLTPTLSIGAYATNINQPKISDAERIPTRLAAGLAFKPIDKLLLITELEKDLQYDPTWKGGLEYVIHKKVFVRTGFNIKPDAAFFGLGFHTWRLKLDYALQYSSTIHFSQQASAVYALTQKRKDEK